MMRCMTPDWEDMGTLQDRSYRRRGHILGLEWIFEYLGKVDVPNTSIQGQWVWPNLASKI
jgi:hypothetical protein